MKTFRLIGTKPAILSRHNRQSLGNDYKNKRHHIGSAISILVIVIGTVAGGLASLVIAAPPAFAGLSSSTVTLYASPSGSTTATTCTTSTGSGVCSLQSALSAAASYSGYAVTIDLEHTNGNVCNSTSTCTFAGPFVFGSSGSSASSVTIEPYGTVSSASDVVLNGNSSSSVFADLASSTIVTLEDIEITGGSGGILNDNTGTVNVTDSTIYGNSGTYGGGIYNASSGTVNVTDSTIYNNSATDGGGIYSIGSGTVNVTDSTIYNNSATDGGGIYNAGSTVNIAGSILENTTGGNCYGGVTDDDYNLSSDATCSFSGTSKDGVTNLDLETTLSNNGGPTETVAITSPSSTAAAFITSPATATLPNPSGSGTVTVDLCGGSTTSSENTYNGANLSQDQRGVSRPATSCSAGAYQYPAQSSPPPPPPPAPSVTSISPTTGSTSGGTTVTITGDNLSGVAYVFFGSTEATSFTIISSTEIQAVSPAESAGTVNVTVTSPGGTSPVTSADQFTYASPRPQPPTVTAISPTSGPTSGGTKVTITGTNFVTGATVKFGSLAATAVTFNSVTSITATSPAESAGTVNVTVTTPGGTSAISTADQFTYQVPVPTVTAISPTSGSTAGGTKVTITGTNFVTGATVKFGSLTATAVTFNSVTSITATSPAESAGTVNVTVTTPVSTSATSTADQFTYITPITGDAYTAVNPASLADTRCSATPQPSYCASENLPTQNSKLTTLSGGASENVAVTGVDNIPSNATAVVINLTVTNMTAGGYLSIYPEGSTQPVVSSLNWTATSGIVANLVTVPVNTTNGEITITNGGTSGSVDFVVDIEGYYAPPTNTPAGLYNPVTPTRIVDTRCVEYPLPPNITTSYCKSLPSVNYTKVAELLSLQTENIAVTGFGGIPTSGVSAVVLNITAIDPSSSGYLTAFPAGSTKALVSTVNFNQAQTVANEAIVKVGTNGEISIYNFLGATNFTVDVTGYYTDGSSSSQTGSLFNPVTPARILDTRCSESPQPSYCASENIPSSNANLSAIQAGKSITVQVAGEANIPSDATAVVGNLTATGSAGSGYLTVYLGSTAPTTSNVNFTAATTNANMVISQLNSSGQMNISASATANALFDVSGWFTASTLYASPSGGGTTCSQTSPCSLSQALSNASSDSGSVTIYLESTSAATCSSASVCKFVGNYTLSSGAKPISIIIEPYGAVSSSSDVVLNGNSAGTVFTDSASSTAVTLEDMEITGGSATDGGGIYNAGTVNVTDSTISGNTATFNGGGIYNAGTVNVTDSTISGNTAINNGSGIYDNFGAVTVTDSTISGNSAGTDGGGIYNYGGGSYNKIAVNVIDSTISGNAATTNGGGIYNAGTVNVTDSTISGNSADTDGGGIYDNSGAVNVTDSTISGNTATTDGGGIYNAGTVNMAGSILDNTGGNCYSGVTDEGYNLSSDATCGFSSSSTSKSSVSNLDLGTLGNNGGPTETVAITSSSAAAFAITNPVVTINGTTVDLCGGSTTSSENTYNGANLSQDQRGVSRPATSCSAGAYQYN